MKYCIAASVIVVSMSFLFAGCQPGGDADKASGSNVYAEGNKDKGHTHKEGDQLHWAKKDLQQDGFTISLGHHGEHFHIGDTIEPAAMIVRDGQDVADAEVFNSLISEDGQTVLVGEIKTVFEPKTDSEPAHYAQGGLKIPEGAEKFQIRFRMKLPGITEEVTLDIEASAH